MAEQLLTHHHNLQGHCPGSKIQACGIESLRPSMQSRMEKRGSVKRSTDRMHQRPTSTHIAGDIRPGVPESGGRARAEAAVAVTTTMPVQHCHPKLPCPMTTCRVRQMLSDCCSSIVTADALVQHTDLGPLPSSVACSPAQCCIHGEELVLPV